MHPTGPPRPPVRPAAAAAIRLAALIAVLMSGSLGASAQTQAFIVSTGPEGNTYDLMFRQFAAQCQGEVGNAIMGKVSSGSMENVDRLINNEVTAAIVQTDVLHHRARSDDLRLFKVLFMLHPEELHLVAPRARVLRGWSALTEKLAELVGRPTLLQALPDLRGRKLGAWGGSFITAQNLRTLSEVDFQLVELADPVAATRALADGSVDAVLAVGGSPLGWVQRLDARYKLLAIGEAERLKLKNVYRPARLSYFNLGQTGVATVATEAVMVTRDYRTPSLVGLLQKVRACLQRHLPDLREKPGNHAKWQAVDLAAQPKWPLLDLPPLPAGLALPAATLPATRRAGPPHGGG